MPKANFIIGSIFDFMKVKTFQIFANDDLNLSKSDYHHYVEITQSIRSLCGTFLYHAEFTVHPSQLKCFSTIPS